MPASEFMVEFMFQVVDFLNKKGKSASCLFLAYGTSPVPLPFPPHIPTSHPHLTSPLTRIHRPRPRRRLPTTTPASLNPHQPPNANPPPLPPKHNPNRRLRRRQPRALPPLPHQPPTPLAHHPARRTPLAIPRLGVDLPLGKLRHHTTFISRERVQRLRLHAWRQEMERCIPVLSVATRRREG